MALQITFSAEDHLALVMGIGSNDVQLPQRTITRQDFPGAPPEAIGQPVPILYGDLRESAGAASLDPPLWVRTYDKGLIYAGDFEITDEGRRTGYSGTEWVAGRGDMPGTTAAPTTVTIADSAGGTIDRATIVWNDRIYAMAYCVDPAGVPSETYPYDAKPLQSATYTSRAADAVYVDFTDDDRKVTVTVTWPGAAGTGWTAVVFIGHNYYGARWMQTRTIAYPTTTVDFDAYSTTPITLWGEWPLSTSATWTYDGYQSPGGWFHVRAYNTSGEGPASAPIRLGGAYPYQRPAYFAWTAVTGATGYRVYQLSDSDGVTPTRYWDVGNVTETHAVYPEGDGSIAVEIKTPARGIPVRHVGPLPALDGTLWDAWLVAGHACHTVSGAYLNGEAIASSEYGVSLMLPGQTGFAAAFGDVSREINGQRFTLVYARGSVADRALVQGETLTIDVCGIEDVGDGSGTLITDLFEQYEHLLRNWVPATALGRAAYLTGAWQTSGPTWGDTPYDVDVIDGASFVAAKAIADARIAGGYTGAFGIGLDGMASVRDWVARLNQSADCYCGFTRKSQFAVKLLHATQTLVDAAPSYSDTLGILRDTFRIEDDVLMIENRLTGRYDYNWTDGSWRRGVTLEDVDAQVAVGETRPYELALYCTRNPAQAWDITNRRLTRRKFPYRVVSFESDMGALTIDLGDLVRITHYDGLGASGWTDRAGWVLRHEFDPSRFTVALDVLDVDYLINPVTEDMTWLPTLAWCADGGAFVIGTEDCGVLGSEHVTVTESPTATPA